ncbi:hypothetical protein KG383_005263 [Salmonella enterica subsp. enterica serovar Newport]|nr:hypothetical protein [Salmonella enterica subsp. enterica serovar Newport]HDC2546495.1 hypothetical protein [Salmonella enterica]HDC2562245.1 hypothetical protein [Salmonella enterica]
MSRTVVPGLSDLVWFLICENPGIFKHELLRMVNERLDMIIPESDLSDVISCLKLYRGVFGKRGYGYFRDENTFSEYSFGRIPGKEVRRKRREFGDENK